MKASYQLRRLSIIIVVVTYYCCCCCCNFYCNAFNSQLSRPSTSTTTDAVVSASSSNTNNNNPDTTLPEQLSASNLLREDGYHEISRIRRFQQNLKRRMFSTYGSTRIAQPSSGNMTTTTVKHYNDLRDDILIVGLEDYLINSKNGDDTIIDDIISTLPSHDDNSDILIIGLDDKRRKQQSKQLESNKIEFYHYYNNNNDNSDTMEVDNMTNTLANMANRLSWNTADGGVTTGQQLDDSSLPKLKVIIPQQQSSTYERIAFRS